jgi:hypothetical protein
MPIRPQQPRQPSVDLKLPRAQSQVSPSTARRFTIFGTSNVMNNLSESDLSKDLGVPVRVIPAANCTALREKIGQIDPALDRFVLVHGLCNDARTIALQAAKTDLEKGAESDQVLNINVRMQREHSEMKSQKFGRLIPPPHTHVTE